MNQPPVVPDFVALGFGRARAPVPTDRELKILLVDDEEEEFLLTRNLLKRAGAPGLDLRWAPTYETGVAAPSRGGIAA